MTEIKKRISFILKHFVNYSKLKKIKYNICTNKKYINIIIHLKTN